jgi:hypothetical protein
MATFADSPTYSAETLALLGRVAPAGLAIVQTVEGAEKNTFTTRVAIQGTLVNASSALPGTAGTIPAGLMNVVGRTMRIRGGGTTGTTATPNWTFDIAMGATVIATTLAKAAVATTTPAAFTFDVLATVLSTGATGTIISVGSINMASATNATATWAFCNTTPGTATTVDLTADKAITFNATCSASDAANRVRLHALTVEILN